MNPRQQREHTLRLEQQQRRKQDQEERRRRYKQSQGEQIRPNGFHVEKVSIVISHCMINNVVW